MSRSIIAATAAIALMLPVPAFAEAAARLAEEALPLDQQVRCAGLFAVVAAEQARKVPDADRFPPLAVRGREFFVKTGLRLMHEQNMAQDLIEPYFRAQIAVIQEDYAKASDPKAKADAEMRGCLAMLDLVEPAQPNN